MGAEEMINQRCTGPTCPLRNFPESSSENMSFCVLFPHRNLFLVLFQALPQWLQHQVDLLSQHNSAAVWAVDLCWQVTTAIAAPAGFRGLLATAF